MPAEIKERPRPTRAVVYAGRHDWRSVTVGMPMDMYKWLDDGAARQNEGLSTYVRKMLKVLYDAR